MREEVLVEPNNFYGDSHQFDKELKVLYNIVFKSGTAQKSVWMYRGWRWDVYAQLNRRIQETTLQIVQGCMYTNVSR